MKPNRTSTPVLIAAMRILARDIQSEDGVANAAISEASDRLEEFEQKLDCYCAALEEIYQELSHYPDGDGIFGHLKRILRRAIPNL